MAYKDISPGRSHLSDSATVTTTAFPGGYISYYNGQPTIKTKQ